MTFLKQRMSFMQEQAQGHVDGRAMSFLKQCMSCRQGLWRIRHENMQMVGPAKRLTRLHGGYNGHGISAGAHTAKKGHVLPRPAIAPQVQHVEHYGDEDAATPRDHQESQCQDLHPCLHWQHVQPVNTDGLPQLLLACCTCHGFTALC